MEHETDLVGIVGVVMAARINKAREFKSSPSVKKEEVRRLEKEFEGFGFAGSVDSVSSAIPTSCGQPT